ncbi:MAG: hypothetical protein NTU96_08325 [Actinobacteria bacterium]|nr:hypothetical protein [Actinomycetota bacterium]MCX6507067.1 hypothetical protein [Actinomycetota bacterium]
MTSRGIKVFIAALALSAAVVAGCSSSKKDQTPITGTVPTTSVAPTTAPAAASGSTTTVVGTMSGMGSTTTVAR